MATLAITLPVAASRVVARLASGDLTDATVAQILTLLDILQVNETSGDTTKNKLSSDNLALGWEGAREVANSGGNRSLTGSQGMVVKRNSVTEVEVDAFGVDVHTPTGIHRLIPSTAFPLNAFITTAGGVGGLDTGMEAADTWYYLWLIDKLAAPAPALMITLEEFSVNFTALPAGYDMAGIIGVFRNDSGSDIVDFHQIADDLITVQAGVLTNGNATTYTSVSLSTVIPTRARWVTGWIGTSDDGTAASQVDVASDPNGLGNITVLGQGTSADNPESAPFRLMLKTAQTLYYKVAVATNNASIRISGWGY